MLEVRLKNNGSIVKQVRYIQEVSICGIDEVEMYTRKPTSTEKSMIEDLAKEYPDADWKINGRTVNIKEYMDG